MIVTRRRVEITDADVAQAIKDYLVKHNIAKEDEVVAVEVLNGSHDQQITLIATLRTVTNAK